MINQEIFRFPCSFQRNPHESSNTKGSHTIPHLNPGLASASHSQKAQGTLQHCAILFSSISDLTKKINQNNQRSCERLHSGNSSNLKMVHVLLCGWYASFFSGFFRCSSHPFFFVSRWMAIPSPKPATLWPEWGSWCCSVWCGEPGRSRCRCTWSG